jgi:hypothetical protein
MIAISSWLILDIDLNIFWGAILIIQQAPQAIPTILLSMTPN